MKKYFGIGLLACSLIAAGGTGAYIEKVKDNTAPASFMQQGMGSGKLAQMMNSANSNNIQPLAGNQQNNSQDNAFEQMLPYMKKMHPGLSDQQLKALYDEMMGPNGACSQMMGGVDGTTGTASGTSTGGNL